jgi:hypothetical protein
MTTLTRDELLILLIEECSEVIHAATKCLRFGYDVDNGTGYGNNRDALSREFGDLAAIGTYIALDSGEAYKDALYSKIKRAEEAKAKYGASVTNGDR